MKKFFIFLFNFLCWCFDSVLFLFETLVELVLLVLNFFFTWAIDSMLSIGRQFKRLFQVDMWNISLREKPFDGFYIRRAARTLLVFWVQIVALACILQGFPQVRAFFGPIGLFFGTPRVQVITIICGFIFLLPQQQLFRDPVTRSFFRRGWFKNYGHASFFTKCLSFLIILALFCAAWAY